MTFWISAIALRAGEFINLGFNDPDLSNAYDYVDPSDPLMRPGRVAPALEALRGWSITPAPAELLRDGAVYVDGGGGVFYLVPSIGGQVEQFGTYYMHMNYLASGGPAAPPRPAISFSQLGLVPVGASQLRFYEFGGTTPIEVYLAGVRQSVTVLDSTLTIKAIDVSAFAGTEVALEFLFPEGLFKEFDILGFEPVPEPTTWIMAMVGGAGLLALRRRRR